MERMNGSVVTKKFVLSSASQLISQEIDRSFFRATFSSTNIFDSVAKDSFSNLMKT